jgi:hypothetical protein
VTPFSPSCATAAASAAKTREMRPAALDFWLLALLRLVRDDERDGIWREDSGWSSRRRRL